MSFRVRVSHPGVITDLIEALWRGDCVPDQVAADTCVVVHPFAFDDREASIEIGFFLKAWQARHPGVAAELVGN
jgi:hypothetical protein